MVAAGGELVAPHLQKLSPTELADGTLRSMIEGCCIKMAKISYRVRLYNLYEPLEVGGATGVEMTADGRGSAGLKCVVFTFC